MKFTMDDYTRLTAEGREAIRLWADQYVTANCCFGFEIASDGPATAAQFWLYDFEMRQPGMDEIPCHTEMVLAVDPLPNLVYRRTAP